MWVGQKFGYLGNILLLAGTAKAVKVGAGAKTQVKTLELAKDKVRNNDKTPERIPVMLIIIDREKGVYQLF